jgi:hypothetical protein
MELATMNPKPLTKALHTRRVVYRLALLLLEQRPSTYITARDRRAR